MPEEAKERLDEDSRSQPALLKEYTRQDGAIPRQVKQEQLRLAGVLKLRVRTIYFNNAFGSFIRSLDNPRLYMHN